MNLQPVTILTAVQPGLFDVVVGDCKVPISYFDYRDRKLLNFTCYARNYKEALVAKEHLECLQFISNITRYLNGVAYWNRKYSRENEAVQLITERIAKLKKEQPNLTAVHVAYVCDYTIYTLLCKLKPHGNGNYERRKLYDQVSDYVSSFIVHNEVIGYKPLLNTVPVDSKGFLIEQN